MHSGPEVQAKQSVLPAVSSHGSGAAGIGPRVSDVSLGAGLVASHSVVPKVNKPLN